MGFLEWNGNILIDSLKKIDWNILLIIFLDSVFYLASGSLVFFWLSRVMAKLVAFQLPTDIISLGKEGAQHFVSEIRFFYVFLIASFVIVLAAIIFLASILKGVIWAKTTKTRISFSLISRFLTLNLIWMGFWFVAVILMSILIDTAASAFVIGAAIILSLYISNTLYPIFMREQRLSVILKAIRISFAKIHMFLFPYSIIVIFFFILVKASKLANFKYSEVIATIILIILAALVRYYHSELVLNINREKSKTL